MNRERLAPIIISVLHKFVLRLHTQNIVVSITGGLQVSPFYALLSGGRRLDFENRSRRWRSERA